MARKFLLLLLFTVAAAANLIAQVPVREEPRHKTVLENEYIRLLDVHLPPADTTQYHIHATPSVIVFLSKSVIGTQDKSGKGLPSGPVTPAQTLFVDYASNPVTHRVYNDSTNTFHVMDIELVKTQPPTGACAPLQLSGVETTINEKQVTVYRLQMQPHQNLNIPAGNCAYLLICVTGEVKSANKKIAAREFLFFNRNDEMTLKSLQKNTTCVLLQLQ